MGMLLPTITLFGTSCFLSSRFSSRNRLAPIAFLIRMRILSMESGFSKKSYAPNFVARTAVSMVPCPEIIMTSGAFSFSRIFCRVSRPSIPGSQTSSRTRSKSCLPRISRPASPLSASEALKPSSSSTPFSDWRIVGSSSTMRMLCMLVDGGRDNRFGHDWQLNYESRAYGLIFFHTNRAVVIFDYPIHDGESQTGAALLGGEIWHEQTLFQFAGNSVTGVGDSEFNHIAVRKQHRRNLDLAKKSIVHGFCSIVYQIGQRSLDGFAVGHYVGQIRRKRCPHANLVQPLMKHCQSAFHN